MKVNTRAVDFKADKGLVAFIEERAGKLSQFFDKIIEVEVHLHVENTSDKENKQVDFIVRVPGDNIVVKKTAKKFEEAVDMAAETAERQLKKRKEKLNSH